MADLYFRSYNPIWNFRDLTGLPLDDNSYVWFLENEIPYAPQTVYHSSTGTAWSNPVQLSAAGTLENIFFQDKVYRLEVRTNDGTAPPSSADELVWLIENYVPDNGGGDQPVTSGNFTSNNLITNPQWRLIDFNSPCVLTGVSTQTINVAPGWYLYLESSGTGDVTLTRTAISGTEDIVTNPPYELTLTLSSWDTAYLYQKFDHASGLWSGKHLSVTLAAKIDGSPQEISTTLNDQDGNVISTLIDGVALGSTFKNIEGTQLIDTSTNATDAETAYMEYRIILPGTSTISLTSIQLVAGDTELRLPFEQVTTEREIDHTFHNYRDSIIFMPKSSLLTGWDFALNPWQFRSSTVSDLAGTGGDYTADQTIVVSEETDSIQVGRSADPVGYFEVKSKVGAAQGSVAIIQYIDPATIAPYWKNSMSGAPSSYLSALVQAVLVSTPSTPLTFKMNLIYGDALPTVSTNPIASWSGGEPVYTADWTKLTALNDPEYTVTSALQDFPFNQFELPSETATTSILGIVLYTTTDLSSASADRFLIKNVSLVPNEFAIQSNILTFDETLRRCEYYYEKSYEVGVVPGTVSEYGKRTFMSTYGIASGMAFQTAFTLNYKTVKRANPDITFYSPTATTADRILLQVNRGNTQPAVSAGSNPSLQDVTTNYVENTISRYSVTYYSNVASSVMTVTTPTGGEETLTIFHYVADARIKV